MYEEMAEFPLPFSATGKTAPPVALFSLDGRRRLIHNLLIFFNARIVVINEINTTLKLVNFLYFFLIILFYYFYLNYFITVFLFKKIRHPVKQDLQINYQTIKTISFVAPQEFIDEHKHFQL